MVMESRYKMGKNFYDDEFYKTYKKIGYPDNWIEESLTYAPDDAYCIMHPSWVHEELPQIPECSIYDLFKSTVKSKPDNTSVIFLEKSISYKYLEDLTSRYAGLLNRLGVKKNDVVATMLPNSLQHIVAFYGVTKLGAIHTPINIMYKTHEIEYQVEDSGAKIICCLDILYPRIKPLMDQGKIEHVIVTSIHDFAAPDFVPPQNLRSLWEQPKAKIEGTMDFFSEIEKADPVYEVEEVNPKEDVALILYTSGTTGRPKGVLCTHFNMVYNSLTHTHAFRVWGDHEVNLSIMPMFHTAGYYLHFLPVMYQGGTIVPIPLFDVEYVINVIEKYKVNVVFAPPTFYIALMSRADLLSKEKLKSLACSVGCGAPVPQEVQKKWFEYTGLSLTNGWGMTETNSGGIISIPERKENSTSIGIPIFSEAKIVGENGEVLKRGERGEIYYRGLQVAKGYHNKEEETKSNFLSDGWFKTGDMGYIDEDDFVYFVDRLKDLIIASGYNIAPVEVENVLYKHPAVQEAAVIGVPDEYRGETVKAYIALKPEYKGNVTEEEIINFCRENLANFKVPRIVEFRDELPKSAVGKILRRKLKE
ncbi:long-chain fatty acid--CoA ligase [Desulfothermus okinawensis JCM 13304]